MNGTAFTAVLWSDPNGDGNPIDAVVLATAAGVVSGAGTNAFITLTIPATMVTTANFFVGFKITHGAGQFSGALDTTPPTFANRSFIAAGRNINNLAGAFPIEGLVAGNWLIRADGTNGPATVPEVGASVILLGASFVLLAIGRRVFDARNARCPVKA